MEGVGQPSEPQFGVQEGEQQFGVQEGEETTQEKKIDVMKMLASSEFKCLVGAVILVLLMLVLLHMYGLLPSKERAANQASDLEILNTCRKATSDKYGLARAEALTKCVADARRARDAQEHYTAATANVNPFLEPQKTQNYVDQPALNANGTERMRENNNGFRSYIERNNNGPPGRAVNPLMENMDGVKKSLQDVGQGVKNTMKNVGSALGIGQEHTKNGVPGLTRAEEALLRASGIQ